MSRPWLCLLTQRSSDEAGRKEKIAALVGVPGIWIGMENLVGDLVVFSIGNEPSGHSPVQDQPSGNADDEQAEPERAEDWQAEKLPLSVEPSGVGQRLADILTQAVGNPTYPGSF